MKKVILLILVSFMLCSCSHKQIDINEPAIKVREYQEVLKEYTQNKKENLEIETRKGLTNSQIYLYHYSFDVNQNKTVNLDYMISTLDTSPEYLVVSLVKKINHKDEIHQIHKDLKEVSDIVYKISHKKIDTSIIVNELYNDNDYDNVENKELSEDSGIEVDDINYSVSYKVEKISIYVRS